MGIRNTQPALPILRVARSVLCICVHYTAERSFLPSPIYGIIGPYVNVGSLPACPCGTPVPHHRCRQAQGGSFVVNFFVRNG